jgi:hypothetical protein
VFVMTPKLNLSIINHMLGTPKLKGLPNWGSVWESPALPIRQTEPQTEPPIYAISDFHAYTIHFRRTAYTEISLPDHWGTA